MTTALPVPTWITRETLRAFETSLKFTAAVAERFPPRGFVDRDGTRYACQARRWTLYCGACRRGVVWPRRIKFCRVCGAKKVGRWNRRDWGLASVDEIPPQRLPIRVRLPRVPQGDGSGE